MHSFSTLGSGDLGGSVVLGERTRAVVTGETDLLRRWWHEFATVCSHGETTRANVESGTLELEFPGVHLPPVGLTPGLKLDNVFLVANKPRHGMAHC